MHKSFSSPLDVAMISVERLSALAGLLAIEDVVSAFANLSPLAQVALFGTFESGLVEVRTALLQMAENGVDHGHGTVCASVAGPGMSGRP
ncbi:hypothetical protein [Burkholderia oklahomensis]|uniref:hypothetical protein n=1 Tax=Burkholderia oklahomensis TaxID=342113 RepID=UPI00016A9792|nr:hypothetical protein [Burkholderia oklahomensis]AJX32202.1 hypothetical protein BG90_1674 [Burkholderia oklahomensis C6786]SUW58700.1 Uncharacterised protein [Burkholderia oklahomensis]